jgi:hypothetical protein
MSPSIPIGTVSQVNGGVILRRFAFQIIDSLGVDGISTVSRNEIGVVFYFAGSGKASFVWCGDFKDTEALRRGLSSQAFTQFLWCACEG